MKRIAFVAAVVGVGLTAVAFVQAQSETNRLTVPFSDPSRPGTVKVSLFKGGLTVRASTGRDVVVMTSDARITNAREEPSGKGTGLRRLSQPPGISTTEENNVMTISSGHLNGGGDLDIRVPARTNLTLSTVSGDEILVERVEGDIEVTAFHASITLADVAGAVVVHSMSGDVKVLLRQVTAQKPMSFTAFNGDVDVTLPPSVKANLKMRTDRGEVLTDFDVQIQQRPATPSPAAGLILPSPPPPPPLPPGGDSRELERQVRDRERQVRELERQIRGQKGGIHVELDRSIYGSVNGGGPEFELRTFNGDIYLRRGK